MCHLSTIATSVFHEFPLTACILQFRIKSFFKRLTDNKSYLFFSRSISGLSISITGFSKQLYMLFITVALINCISVSREVHTACHYIPWYMSGNTYCSLIIVPALLNMQYILQFVICVCLVKYIPR